MSSAARPRRRFAPLNPAKANPVESPLPKLKGIVFDVDGTLCEPQTYMFAEMRAALNFSKGEDILEHIYAMPLSEQDAAMEKIKAVERAGMAKQTPQPGLVELMDFLERRRVPKGICTRNFDMPVEHLLTKFLPGRTFEPVITRAFRPPKPDPAGILHIANAWGLSDGGESLIMVGDSIDDMTAGRKAGAATVLLVNSANETLKTHENTDLCITRLDDLVDILDEGFISRELD